MGHDRRDIRTRLRALVFPALLGPAQLLFFGPFATYERNEAEFSATFWSIAGQWLWMSLALVAAIVAVGLLLRPAAFRRYVALLFAAGVLLWVQGNLLVADYGPLYGEALDLARNDWRAPLEIGVWIAAIALAVYFAGRVASVAPLASGVLIALQATVVAATGVVEGRGGDAQRGGDASGSRRWRQPPDAIYQLSRTRNVVHIVLDGFLSEVFGEIVEKERAAIDRSFSGFVFFADHLGAFPTTRASMPAMLRGVTYRNDVPFNDFLRATQRQSVFSALSGAGYRISSVMFHTHEQPRERFLRGPLARYNIPTPYGTYQDYLVFTAAQLFDLTLFRHVPHGAKSWVYNDEAWLTQNWSETQRARSPAARRARPSNHVIFLDEFTTKLSADVDEPVYLFLHVAVPHPPVVLDSECGFIGPQRTTRDGYAGQARCAIAVVERFLERLRALNVYDRSAIVVTADHGWPVRRDDHPFAGIRGPAGRMDRVVLSAMPLLAVKPRDSSGPLQISGAPTSITDIPATILDLAGVPEHDLPGQSAFAIDGDAPRPRTFAFHTWANAHWRLPYQDVLHVFSVEGRALDPKAWTFRQAIFEPTKNWDARLASRDTGLSPVLKEDSGPFRRGEQHAVTYAPPDARLFTVSAARSPRATYPQTVTVRVDGRVAARRELTGDAWQTLRVPLRKRGDEGQAFTIELIVDPPAFEENGTPFAARYRDLGWSR